MSKFVSVLMPVYNSENYVARAIISVLEQTYRNFEFIIINDNSTDKTIEILKSFTDPRIKLRTLDKKVGITKALNLGIKLASGEYIIRMDSDDICLKDRFSNQVHFMTSNPGIAVSSGRAIIMQGNKITNKIISIPKTHQGCMKFLVSGRSCFIHPATIINRVVLSEKNLYNSEYPFAQDYKLWTRLSQNYTFGNISKVLIYYRIHEKSISQLHMETQSTLAKKAHINYLKLLLKPYLSNLEMEKMVELVIGLNKPTNLKIVDIIYKQIPNDLRNAFVGLFKIIICKNIYFLNWNPKDKISFVLHGYYFKYKFKYQILKKRT